MSSPYITYICACCCEVGYVIYQWSCSHLVLLYTPWQVQMSEEDTIDSKLYLLGLNHSHIERLSSVLLMSVSKHKNRESKVIKAAAVVECRCILLVLSFLPLQLVVVLCRGMHMIVDSFCLC